ncbi:Reticuline oxidase [Acorus calamus]|uniref:Reticuline oxidase n=1 Tax=Acorus calamus TaxID=4465 RepID=A0AAV9D887_ACOCL|nr:Reticuline oxidase [Acorus calamus]
MEHLHLLLLSLSLLITSTTTTSSSSTDFASCLKSNNINNFTLSSDTTTSSSFNHFLNYSIQNLRFNPDSSPLKPVALVLPDTLRRLRATVLCSRRASLTIRLRSGGHSYEGLSYVSSGPDPFVVVDMMNLNRVRVSPETQTAWVEAGATLGETYFAIHDSAGSRLGLSAGSCPTVGIGGHVGGGGFGLLSRKHGLAADNVLDAVVVDADSRVLDRTTMGEDAFWAVRGGGGGSWAAVYAWKLRLVPVPERVTGFVINRAGPTQLVTQLVHEWQRVAHGLPDEFYLSAFVGAGLPEYRGEPPGLSVTFKGFYQGGIREAVEVLAGQFPELGVEADECKEMSWIESIVYFSGLGEGRSVNDLKDRVMHDKKFFKAKSDYVRSPITYVDLYGAFEVLAEQPKAYLILDPYGGLMSRIESDAIPFPHRDGNIYAVQYLIEWRREDDWRSDEYMKWLRLFYEYMRPFVSAGPRAAYVNYLDLDLGTTGSTGGGDRSTDSMAEARRFGERYFLGNYDRLVRAKTAIDPDNVFCNPQTIPPLPRGRSASVASPEPSDVVLSYVD